jgi:hypothetical protein
MLPIVGFAALGTGTLLVLAKPTRVAVVVRNAAG